ncbi:Class II abasic (AP) endonuclease [Tulasnella sp. JGI-2019a]|nr:Class II abasic (AP) endonuclease [Tulasnella sp. JGI-2019a]KAG9002851.1 Class II abasic (AP) endonuclease [Tulasnella sp. JGI-2019a]
MPQYHPWYALKTCEAMLEKLGADIICFQEMKISRSQLDQTVALPGPFDGFFSFPVAKGGYSGVAVYSNSRTCTVLKAEEGLTGAIQPKPPLAPSERISASANYPDPDDFDFYPEDDGVTPSSFESIRIDQEGRALLVDYGLFVLVNVYCPAETSESRLPFKVNFHRLLEKRVDALIKEGREVIVVGDINVAATPLDHGEGSLASRQVGFWERPARAWFKAWLNPEGPMIDAIREFHPDREGMYTCWSVLLSARESNYGSRIDYILVTKGLRPWLKFGDIQSDIRGSDHCPVYIDLHDEITLPSGATVQLADVMRDKDPRQSDGLPRPRAVPRLCARQWDEFSGKQKLLSNFFQKKADEKREVTPLPGGSQIADPASATGSQGSRERENVMGIHNHQSTALMGTPGSDIALGKRKKSPSLGSDEVSGTRYSKLSRPKGGKEKKSSGQAMISSFFIQSGGASGSKTPPVVSSSKRIKQGASQPTSTSSRGASRTRSTSVEILHISSDEDLPPAAKLLESQSSSDTPIDADQVESDYILACSLAEEGDPHSALSLANPSSQTRGKDSQAWKKLLAPLQPPLCTVHKEPAKRFVVNKPGPNKGKTFFICSRPVGPGYDKGRAERLREEVNPQFRCDFFKWASDVRKESMRPE